LADLVTIIAIAGAAALASPIGGLIALWRKPTTLFRSVALGFVRRRRIYYPEGVKVE
jgi:zinc transporter, ZIP family